MDRAGAAFRRPQLDRGNSDHRARRFAPSRVVRRPPGGHRSPEHPFGRGFTALPPALSPGGTGEPLTALSLFHPWGGPMNARHLIHALGCALVLNAAITAPRLAAQESPLTPPSGPDARIPI